MAVNLSNQNQNDTRPIKTRLLFYFFVGICTYAVTSWKIVTPHNFHVRLFEQRNPEFIPLIRIRTEQLSITVRWKVVVDDDLPGYSVQVQLDHVLAERVVDGTFVWRFRVDYRCDQFASETFLVESAHRQARHERTIWYDRLLYAQIVGTFTVYYAGIAADLLRSDPSAKNKYSYL